MIEQQENILQLADQWLKQERQVALATVVATWGSSPRPCGSQLVIDNEANFIGSVSGGCVEAAVITEALDIIKTRNNKLIEFSVSNEIAWDVGLTCGGTIKIYVEAVVTDDCLYHRLLFIKNTMTIRKHMQSEMLEQLDSARQQRQAVVLITCLDRPTQYLDNKTNKNEINVIPGEWKELAMKAISSDKSQLHETKNGKVFFHVFNPTFRMFIVGAVHITQSLAPLATMAGYDVTIVDPRQSFATNERFPNIKFNTAWPDKALEKLAPDNRTTIVVLSHDPKLDDPALEIALKSEAFYIGALGSRKSHSKRLKRLQEKGVSLEQQKRIHGPVGLDIGANSPAEIAISIMAQVTEKRYSDNVKDQSINIFQPIANI